MKKLHYLAASALVLVFIISILGCGASQVAIGGAKYALIAAEAYQPETKKLSNPIATTFTVDKDCKKDIIERLGKPSYIETFQSNEEVLVYVGKTGNNGAFFALKEEKFKGKVTLRNIAQEPGNPGQKEILRQKFNFGQEQAEKPPAQSQPMVQTKPASF